MSASADPQPPVVLVASSLCADIGSEPQVAWRWLQVFARRWPVILVCEPFWRERIERALAQAPQPHRVEVHYVDMPLGTRMSPNSGVFLRQYWWLWRVGRYVDRHLGGLRSARIAYVTLSTTYFLPLALRGAGRLWWGPVGGGFADWPGRYMVGQGTVALARELVRAQISRVITAVGRPLLGSHRVFAVARTEDAADELRSAVGLQVQGVIPEVITLKPGGLVASAMGLPGDAAQADVTRAEAVDQAAGTVSFAFVGGVRRSKKNFPLALALARAFALASASRSVGMNASPSGDEVPVTRLHVFGEDEAPSVRAAIDQQASPLQLVWHGKLDRPRYVATFRELDGLLFPSYREGYSSTLLEAISLGIPVALFPVGGNRDFVGHPLVIELDPLRLHQEAYLSDVCQRLRRLRMQVRQGTLPLPDDTARWDRADLADALACRFMAPDRPILEG